MWRLVGPGVVVKAIRARMGPILMEWLTTPVPTGRKKKITSEDGTSEIDEKLSPLDTIIINAGEVLYRKMLGIKGGDVRKRQALENDVREGVLEPGSPIFSLLNSINPKIVERAIRDGDYIPILLDMFGPQLQRMVEAKLSKPGTLL